MSSARSTRLGGGLAAPGPLHANYVQHYVPIRRRHQASLARPEVRGWLGLGLLEAMLGTSAARSSELLNPQISEQRAADPRLYTRWSLDPDHLDPTPLPGGQGCGGALYSLWVEDKVGIDTPPSRTALDQQVYERGRAHNAAALSIGGEGKPTRLAETLDLPTWLQRQFTPMPSIAPGHGRRFNANDAQVCGRSHTC